MYLWAADTHFDTAVVSPREQGEAWAAHFPESRGILLTGDMGTSRCLKQVLTDLRDGLNRPVYFVLGNHDYWYSSFRRVDEEVRAELREALDDGRADDALPRVRAERGRRVARVLHGRELLREAVAVLGRLAAALAQVGHHRVRGVVADARAAARPRRPPAPEVEVVE